MAIIYSYPKEPTINLSDTLLGTNGDNRTVNFLVSDLISYINTQAGNSIVIGVANGLSLSGSTLSLGLSSASTNGALSAANWVTFNNKQNALTFSSPLINTSNTISIAPASASVSGYLTSANWSTFNSKQDALNGTGFVKISGTTISYDNNTYVPTTRTITANAPLTGGGDLSANRSISINQATELENGYLSSTDWNVFNNKQNALNGTGFVKISGTTISYDNSTYALDSTVVKTTGDQAISGDKNFQNAARFNSNINLLYTNTMSFPTNYACISADAFGFYLGISSTKIAAFTINGLTSNRNYTFPNTSGTITLGTGTAGYVPKFTTSNIVGNSLLFDNGTGVGINTASISYTLHVNGSVAGTSAYVNLSDRRYKKDIQPIESALEKVLSLNGVTFNWDKEATDMNLDDNNHIGLLAQDVEMVVPQAVVTANDENNTKSVAYTDLIPVLIEAIKELKAEIDLLKK